MANPNPTPPPKETRWKPGQSGNPKGKPKGSKHLSTWIQELLSDEKFEFIILDTKDKEAGKKISYQGAPVKAIVGVAIHKAIKGDQRWAEWLAKHGYGLKVKLDSTDPVEEVLRRFGLVDEGDESAGQAEEPES